MRGWILCGPINGLHFYAGTFVCNNEGQIKHLAFELWKGQIITPETLQGHTFNHFAQPPHLILVMFGTMKVHICELANAKPYKTHQSAAIFKNRQASCCWTRLVVKLHAPIWLCNKQRKRPTDWVPIVQIVPPYWALIVPIVPPYTPPIDLLDKDNGDVRRDK